MNYEKSNLPINNSIYIRTDLSMASADWEFIEYSGSSFHDSLRIQGGYRHSYTYISKVRIRFGLNERYKLANQDQVDFFLETMANEGYNRHVYYTPDKDGNNIVDRIDWRHADMKGAR